MVLVWAGELGPIERDRWERESPDKRVERVRSMSEDSTGPYSLYYFVMLSNK